jgi:serine/threonine protein kinase
MTKENIGRYEIQSEIGRGGMAVVYLAHDPNFRRNVAVKLVTSLLQEETVIRERFEREAQLIAKIEHPAIVPVYDFGEHDGQPFLVMRYMQGGSLAAQIKQGKRTLQYAAQILSQIAPALDAVHAQGIVHRDLKPGNLLLDGFGNPAISDFGIAHFSSATTDLTGSAVIGTPAYMSPEQVRADVELDGRSDIYALGVILFEMLTGRGPFNANTPISVALKHLSEPIPSIRSIRADLPPEVDDILNTALAKDREMRFSTAAEMARALQSVADADKGLASPSKQMSSPRLNDLPTEAMDDSLPVSHPSTGQAPPLPPPKPAQPQRTGATPKPSSPNYLRIAVLAGVGLIVLFICGSLGIFGTWAGLSGFFAGQTSTPSPTFAPPATETLSVLQDRVLFADDFSDPNSGWPPAGQNSQGGYGYQSNNYRLHVTESDGVLWVATERIYDNAIMQVDANPTSTDMNGYYGLLCRIVDERNFYYFVIGNNGDYTIGKYKDGTFQSLSGGWQQSAAIRQGAQNNRLKVDCLGNALRFYANETLLGEVTDSDFTSGYSGLVAAALDARGYEVLFDNFQVTQPGQ